MQAVCLVGWIGRNKRRDSQRRTNEEEGEEEVNELEQKLDWSEQRTHLINTVITFAFESRGTCVFKMFENIVQAWEALLLFGGFLFRVL